MMLLVMLLVSVVVYLRELYFVAIGNCVEGRNV